jgi:hypothetical protein
MFVCPSGNVFVSSIDTIGEWKDAHYICNALVGYIETIGVNNIVQICTDNASNMKSAVDLLIHYFSKFLFSKLCCSLSRLAIKRLGKNNMGEANCEKDENYFFFI